MSKIGSTHASAMARQGLRELRAAIYPNSNLAQSPEIGVYGSITPGEVAEDRRNQTLDLEQEKPVAGSAIEQRMPTASEIKAPEREMNQDRG